MVARYPEQEISVAEKLKEDWYRNNAHYWINTAIASNDKADTLRNLQAANGIVDSATYKYVMKPLAGHIDSNIKLPGEIRDIDFITPIKEKMLGEYMDMPYYYMVKINDPEVAILKNKEVADQIKPILEQFVINKLNEAQQTDVPSKEMNNLEQEITNVRDSWFDKRASYVHNTVDHINDEVEFENLRTFNFYNWWATEECYFYSYIKNGQIQCEIINPLEAYPILSGEEFVDDGDAFVIIRKMSLPQVSVFYGDKLSKKDKQYLDGLITHTQVGTAPYSIPGSIYKDAYGRRLIDGEGNEMSDADSFNISSVIKEYIVIYKTKVKKKVVTRINQLGEVVETLEEDNYELNPDLGDIDSRKIWVDEVWKQVLLGDFTSGIYLKPEPIEAQIYDAVGRVKLPVVGKKGLIRGININPIPKRILPSLAFYRIINLQIERLIAKYKSPVEVIPKGLLTSMDGDMKGNMFYKIADGTIIYDETKFNGAELSNSYKIIGNDSTSNFIKFLIDLRELVRQEAWDMANMNQSRYGDAPASATVRNNEQNLHRAKLGSILMINTYNKVLSKLHKLFGELGKIVYDGGLSGSLINNDDNKVSYFNVPGGIIANLSFGIYVVNSSVEKDKLDQYKDLAFSASQSGDFALASEGISATNVSAIRDYIRDYSKRKEEFEEQQREADRQTQLQIQELRNEEKQIDGEQKLKEIELKERLTKEREIAVASIKESNRTSNKES